LDLLPRIAIENKSFNLIGFSIDFALSSSSLVYRYCSYKRMFSRNYFADNSLFTTKDLRSWAWDYITDYLLSSLMVNWLNPTLLSLIFLIVYYNFWLVSETLFWEFELEFKAVLTSETAYPGTLIDPLILKVLRVVILPSLF
jgi:hypothetical protein